ncbi:putative endosomal sorting complex protein TSG101 [Aspergillus stella-maris]|uniref:putative endosomal sorting complex protein TSG101 n=1 Tax=Aspergillus stella-maris TaxID=1810926 RepID=UPI003CCE2A38
MASVPQRTLNWLYSVLIRDHYDPRQTYQDPNRTYYDVANVLAKFPGLAPETAVYTYETGFSALLLQLSGTLPVNYRGTVYKFPIALWIPNTYPREPPIVYVRPTQDMAVRVGQHVTLEGRVYHHYLAHWAGAWERSSLFDLLSILQDVFAKEPPVKYKQQQPTPQPPPQHAQTPPPRPPLPPELATSSAYTPSPQPSTTTSPQPAFQPPPPPPKPGQLAGPAGPQQPNTPAQYSSPPPLPPLPPKEQGYGQPVPSHATSGPQGQVPQYLPHQNIPPGPYQSPPPAAQRNGSHPGPPYYQGPNGASNVPPQQQPRHVQGAQPRPHPAYSQHPPPSQQLNRSPYRATPVTQPPTQHPKPAEDLLTSPFELDLPSFTPTGPAPPIPPNPEKDALLQAVSKALTETLHTNITNSASAAQSLTSQSHSLHSAITTLNQETTSLKHLNSTLESNSSILTQSLHRADAVIADAQSRSSTNPNPSSSSAPDTSGLPPIDDILVPPTVVGKQLYDLVAEERGIQNAIYALQAALVKGVIGVESWSRHTRGLAREAFMKRALIRKVGRGMGLEEV